MQDLLFKIECLLKHLSCVPCLILLMLFVILHLVSIPIVYSCIGFGLILFGQKGEVMGEALLTNHL